MSQTKKKQHETHILGLLQNFDPELRNETAMSLPGSFATIRFSKYVRKEVFKEWAEGDFLRLLTKLINASVEQLRATYAGTDFAQLAVVARQITCVLEEIGGDCESDDDEKWKA